MVLLKAAIHLFIIINAVTFAATSVAEPQQLRGGVVQSFPGITVANGKVKPGSAYGHAEIISCLETSLNVRIEWQSLPTDRLLKLTHENKLDLIYPMGYTEERDSYLQASAWLTRDDDYFIFKAGAISVESLAKGQASNLAIGVKRGSPQQHYLQNHGYKNVHQVYDYQQLLPLLKMDRVEMLAVPQPLAEQLQTEMQTAAEQHNLQLYNYYTRDAGFYMAPAFARNKLNEMNEAVVHCRQYAKTLTAIK